MLRWTTVYHNRHGPKTGGCCAPFCVAWVEAYLHTTIHQRHRQTDRTGRPQQTWGENWQTVLQMVAQQPQAVSAKNRTFHAVIKMWYYLATHLVSKYCRNWAQKWRFLGKGHLNINVWLCDPEKALVWKRVFWRILHQSPRWRLGRNLPVDIDLAKSVEKWLNESERSNFDPSPLRKHSTNLINSNLPAEDQPPCKISFWSDNTGGLGEYPAWQKRQFPGFTFPQVVQRH